MARHNVCVPSAEAISCLPVSLNPVLWEWLPPSHRLSKMKLVKPCGPHNQIIIDHLDLISSEMIDDLKEKLG
jgi:hypothetical protein